jgi:hypothetical protein
MKNKKLKIELYSNNETVNTFWKGLCDENKFELKIVNSKNFKLKLYESNKLILEENSKKPFLNYIKINYNLLPEHSIEQRIPKIDASDGGKVFQKRKSKNHIESLNLKQLYKNI